MATPRMRTIGALAAHYKALDEDTAVTAYFLRTKVLTGEIPHVCAGSKRLISIEAVDAFLAGETSTAEPEPQRGIIRPVAFSARR